VPDFTCSFSQPARAFPHFWEHTVGSGHAPLALRADWQKQMLRCHNELGFQHVRFHALLSDEMGTLIMTNLAMPRHPIETEVLNLRLSDTPEPRRTWIERIDEDHANPRRLWQAMGEPEYLSASQVEQLETASALRKEAQPWTHELGNMDLTVALPPQSAAAITIDFART